MKDDFIVNPTLKELKKFCENTDYKYARGVYIKNEQKYIFYDGYYLTHDDIDEKIGSTIHLFVSIIDKELKLYPVCMTDIYNPSCIKYAIYNVSNLSGEIYEKCKKDYYDKIVLNKNDISFYSNILDELNKNGLLNDFKEYLKNESPSNCITIKKKNEENNVITIVPFYKCNLNCSFCYNTKVKKDETLLDFNKIIKYVKSEMDSINSDEIIIKMYGGELFADFVSSEYYNKLYNFLLDIKQYSSKPVKFSFITNLIHDRYERWIELFNNLGNVELSVSFDLVGRFNEVIFKTFKNNWEVYERYIKDIMITMTKLNILEFMNRNSLINFLNQKLQNEKICLNFIDYVSNKDNDEDIVSNELRFEFYKFLYNNYRKCNVLEQLIMIANGSKTSGKLCSERKSIMPDGNIHSSCTLVSLINNYNEYDEKKKKIKLLMNTKLNCFKCEYFKQCPASCPMSISKMNISEDCYIKQMIQYIKEQNENSNIN